MAPKRKFMEAIESDSDVGGSASSDSDDREPEPSRVVSKTATKSLKLEDLERAGYSSGPSVLHIAAQPQQEPETNWVWSNGAAAKVQESDETIQERQATRIAVTDAVAESAFFATKMMSYAEKLRAEKKAEKAERSKAKALSFKEKEKRKRDAGQQAAGKNYVEEEKRIAREAGVYSGFDS